MHVYMCIRHTLYVVQDIHVYMYVHCCGVALNLLQLPDVQCTKVRRTNVLNTKYGVHYLRILHTYMTYIAPRRLDDVQCT